MLLAAAGAAVNIVGWYSDGTARRIAWSIAILSYSLAALSWVWGDPVRGPFAKLIHPGAPDKFRVHAGGIHAFPVNDLKDGIDFSRVIYPPGPLRLRISRRWLTGMKYDIVLNGITKINSEGVEGLPIGWDVNADDNAVEIVSQMSLPLFQVIQDGDYDVYVNAVMGRPGGSFLILSGDKLSIKPESQVGPEDMPPTIFKYPSYMHRGQRR